MDKNILISRLKQLPAPSLGGIAYDKGTFHDGVAIMNLRDVCVDMINEVMEISKPKEILETGTHAGVSGCLLLSLSSANLTSIDLCNGTGHIEWEFSYRDYFVPGTIPGIKEVKRVLDVLFPDRFRFIAGSSYDELTIKKYSDRKYDLMFIDGDHSFKGCLADCQTAMRLNIPYVLVDDYTTSEDIREAVKQSGLIPIKVYNNIHNTGNVGLFFGKNPNL